MFKDQLRRVVSEEAQSSGVQEDVELLMAGTRQALALTGNLNRR